MTSLDVALFDSFALVVFLFALAGGDDEFDVAASAEETDGDELEAGLTGAFESGELLLGDEELDVAGGIGAESEVIEP